MGDSQTHLDLVGRLRDWVETNTCHLPDVILLVDLPDSAAGEKPPEVFGFNPDLFCSTPGRQTTYIGEAKTCFDIETHRSRQQFTAYLKYLRASEDGTLIVAVPWRCVPQVKSLIRFLIRANDAQNVRTVFLEQLPG